MKPRAGSKPPSKSQAEGNQQCWDEFYAHTQGTKISRKHLAANYFEKRGDQLCAVYLKDEEDSPQ